MYLIPFKRLAFFGFLALATTYAVAKSPHAAAAPVLAKEPAADPAVAKVPADVPFFGEWKGQFAGDVTGTIKVVVSDKYEAVVTCVTDETGRTFEVSGPIDALGDISAIEKSFGPSGIKVRFQGKLTHKGTASGTWENPFFRVKGEWQAHKLSKPMSAANTQ